MFSGFHVSGSITARPSNHSKPLRSGNLEYGYCQALHNEEAAASALAATMTGNERPILTIGAGYGDGGLETITMPCGNCRDIVRDTIGSQCEIVAGKLDGGTAVVAWFGDILCDEYVSVLDTENYTQATELRILAEGKALMKNPYCAPDKHPLRQYVAALSTGAGDRDPHEYIGAHFVGAAFHPTYPIEIAALRAELAMDPYISAVTIVAEGDGTAPPDVPYRDRQQLVELAFECELLVNKPCNPHVRLATYQDGRRTGAWTTSAYEWLPLPFSPRAFGEEFLSQHRTYLARRHSS